MLCLHETPRDYIDSVWRIKTSYELSGKTWHRKSAKIPTRTEPSY